MSQDSAAGQYRFDRFVADPVRRTLLAGGEIVRIGARAFDVLTALIERRNRLVSKKELLDLVWPDLAVEEGNLPVQIFALRRVLGPRAIATVPGRGYQFVLPIEGHEAPGSRAEPSPAQDPAPTPGNLPASLPPLFGRASDAAALEALIAEHRLVSVVGPPGIGKTRLAQAVAHARRGASGDGVWIVELAPIDTPELVVATVARTLGLPVGPSDEALGALAKAMAARGSLVVLDNCEHLANAVGELAGAILATAPGVSLIVTSRTPLRLPEERVYWLGTLAVPASANLASALDYGSVALFVARAQAADERFRLGVDNVGAVVEICARLEGVPLAIELAAARVHSLGLQSVSQHLNELLRLLVGGDRVRPERHRALSTALSWSYDLLSNDERRVLELLGIFVGGFSLRAAEELIADDRIDAWTAREHLSTLVENSLVMVDPGDPPRYRMLETTRAFALDRLTAGDLAAGRRRHALALIATLRSESFQAPPSQRIRIIATEINNLRAAAAWAMGPEGERAIAVELMAETDFVWYTLGYNDEAERLFRAVEPWVDASTQPESAARFWLSRAKLYSASMETAAEIGLRAAEVFRALGNREALFDALTFTAAQFSYAGVHDAAERAIAEARGMLDSSWPGWTRVAFEFWDSDVKYWAGRMAEAREQLLRTLELNRAVAGDASYGEQIEMLILGCQVTLQESGDALRRADALLARERPPIVGSTRAIVESFRVAALAQLGELERAEASLREALPRIRQALGTLRTTLCHAAYLLARQGRCEDAGRIMGAVDALRRPGAPILAPPNRASYEGAAVLVARIVGADELERLKLAGSTLSEEQAVALAFPDLPAVAARRRSLGGELTEGSSSSPSNRDRA